MRRIIVNIDDYAKVPEADVNILHLLVRGYASSVSSFVTSKHFKVAAKNLKPLQHSVSMGPHLDLNFGEAIIKPLPTFDKSKPKSQLPQLYQLLSPNDVYHEFKAQIETYLGQGLPLHHIDNHRPEIYFFPELFKETLKLAAEYDVPVRSPFNQTYLDNASHMAQKFSLPEEMVRKVAHDIIDTQQKLGVRTTEYFSMITDENRTVSGLKRIIESAPYGTTEICTHAGQVREDFRPEFEMLQNKEIVDLFALPDISMENFGQVT